MSRLIQKVSKNPYLNENVALQILMKEYKQNPNEDLAYNIVLFVDTLLHNSIDKLSFLESVSRWENTFGKDYIKELAYIVNTKELNVYKPKNETKLLYQVGDKVRFFKISSEDNGFIYFDHEVDFYNALLQEKVGTIVSIFEENLEMSEKAAYLVTFFNLDSNRVEDIPFEFKEDILNKKEVSIELLESELF